MEKIKLFPNHIYFYDGSKCHNVIVPVYVADSKIDPNNVKKHTIFQTHYPKELVYADNADRSMEEIRAQLYFERYYIFCKHENYLIYIYTVKLLF